MRVRAFASGSKGNSLTIRSGATTVLVDLGLACADLLRRMKACAFDPATVSAILFTHDHDDHCHGLGTYHKKFPAVRLFANDGTAEAIMRKTGVDEGWSIFETASAFDIGDLHVSAFSVPHDAADPVGYLFEDGRTSLFVATDFGTVTAPIRAAFAAARFAILESNHDPELLQKSDRPWITKTRIAGRSGHLTNEAAADLLRATNPLDLKTILLAHLSEECNQPHMALEAMTAACHDLGRADIRIFTLAQQTPSDAFEF